MVTMAAVKLAGFALKTTTKDGENFREIPKFWKACMTDGRYEKLHGETFLKSHNDYGVCFFENPQTEEFEYVFGGEVKDNHDIPDGYHVRTIPGALFAVFSSPPADDAGFSAAIQETWKFIYSEWLPNSEYEFDKNSVDYEFYDERAMDPAGKVCDIYIPVVKK